MMFGSSISFHLVRLPALRKFPTAGSKEIVLVTGRV